jgi:hypothetical protein
MVRNSASAAAVAAASARICVYCVHLKFYFFCSRVGAIGVAAFVALRVARSGLVLCV